MTLARTLDAQKSEFAASEAYMAERLQASDAARAEKTKTLADCQAQLARASSTLEEDRQNLEWEQQVQTQMCRANP